MYIIDSKNTRDDVKKYMQSCEEAREVYTSSNDPLWKDRCIAAINLKLHPEWREQYPALQHMDLSYENVIAKPYREIKEREERALHADEERINKVLKEKPVKVPEKKAPDKQDLQCLSRGAMADELFGHLMKEENTTKNAEDGYEK